jgi:hypothetical protein
MAEDYMELILQRMRVAAVMMGREYSDRHGL